MIRSFIGLGSNLGDSRQILTEAVQKLSTLGPVRTSQLYKSPPMGPQDQPDYLNAVVELYTDLAPLELLDALQGFEQESGRVRLRRWGERTLDLDLLIYGEQQIEHERLSVPHIGLLERDFVLIPLLDLDENLVVKQQLLKTLAIIQQAELKLVAGYNWSTL